MIDSIISMFRAQSTFRSDGEIQLFRNFAVAIQTHASAVFVDETHGASVCNVKFVSATGKDERCEIADLLIVCYEPKSKQLRATFWQAKKQGTSKWINVTNSGRQLDFKGQFNQWDLLSRRPSIVGVNQFSPPPTLLSSFSSAAIGSFGVFYEKEGEIELAHSTAEFISCPTPSAKHPKLTVNGYLDKYFCSEGEAISRLTLDSFLGELLSFRIGSLLNQNEPDHQWLVTRVRSKVLSALGTEDVSPLDAFLRNDIPPEYMEDDSMGGLSVLFLRVEADA